MGEQRNFTEQVIDVVESFRFELCSECGKDLDDHTISPDMFGNAHVWCNSDI